MRKNFYVWAVASALIASWGLGGTRLAAAQVAGEHLKEIHGSGFASPQEVEALPQSKDAAPITVGSSRFIPSSELFTTKTASNGLTMSGNISFTINGTQATINVQTITNSRTTASGPLRLVLVATTTVPVYGQTINGYQLASYSLPALNPSSSDSPVNSPPLAFTAPPAGCYYVTLMLQELQGSDYVYQDLHTFTAGGTPDGSGFDLFSFGGADCSQSPGSCVRDNHTACLLNGRFQVRVSWRTNSATGSGNVMAFAGARAENDESVFFWFFDATNFEMGLKMLNACTFNNKFWVYIGGLTDQGWTVNIVDTKTGASRTYTNPLGHLSTPVGDTSALACP